jgi:signal transduction histidine kinase
MNFRLLTNSGLQFATSPSEKRGIVLSNQISLIISGLSILLFFAYEHWYGWNVVTAAIPLVGLLCLLTIVLNRKGYHALSRVWTSLAIPILATVISIYAKSIYYQQQQELDYFTFRFLILSCCVLPFVLFSLKEQKLLFLTALFGLSILILHDPLHAAFDVGYHQNDLIFLATSSYYFTNVVIGITYCIMIAALLFLKAISEKNENKNITLINELNKANNELLEKNSEIEAQRIELIAQSEVLNANQKKLLETYAQIEKHKNLLYKENKNLTAELLEKNADLIETNTELIKHNNELSQFSFTVSHNLRGPVASLLGLNQLIAIDKFEEEDKVILNHIKSSIVQLDSIIQDLSKIIDIRHDIFKIRQKISLDEEIKALKKTFDKEIRTHHVKLDCDFNNCPEIYSVKPMLYSILYNLIGNSIKYRSPERRSEISITAHNGSEHFIIHVKDNGLGIDVDRHKENLFKLYKRFNYHTEGKGLGLYLVKLQCEALGGYIDVKSELNKFTAFTVYLRKPENIQMQVLYDEKHAKIFYDAKMNTTGVKWFGPVSSENYKSVFTKCLDFLKFYNTPSWLSDISEQGPIDPVVQQWMFTTILPEAARNGLKRIAGVRSDAYEPAVIEYVKGIQATIASLNLKHSFFPSFEEAANWIMEENEKASINTELGDGTTH